MSQIARDALRKASIGKVTVRDAAGNTFKVPIDHPDYISGKLVSTALGTKASELTKAKQRAKKVKSANIYCYYTKQLIAENVIIADWADENGYSRGTLSATANSDKSKPSNKYNPHHHKGVYVVYNNQHTKENTHERFI